MREDVKDVKSQSKSWLKRKDSLLSTGSPRINKFILEKAFSAWSPQA
jgi:hypothetical protein